MSLKRDKVCPQCESRKLWHIERMMVPVREMKLGNHMVPFAVTAEINWAGSVRRHGEFESFICAACGFTEWYAVGLNELQPDPGAGVYYIDDEPKAGLR